MGGVNGFVIGTASWWGWPIWAQVLACLPAICAYLALYGVWYRRRTPAELPPGSVGGTRNFVSALKNERELRRLRPHPPCTSCNSVSGVRKERGAAV